MTSEIRALFDRSFPEVRWSESRWAEAEARLRVRRLAAGATLFAQGSVSPALFGVLQGAVEVRFSGAQGQLSVVSHVEAGRTFGLASFVTGLPSAYEALALEPTRLAVVGHAAYEWLMDDVPGFGRALMREFARHFDGNLKLLEAARHRSAEDRLCIALHQLRHEGRAAAAAGGRWTMRVTQSELATRANVSRQTANEWLAQWATRGWVARGYRSLEIMRWPVPATSGPAG
ncbi:MAG: Crp/Fnr family transcriptional regulator [Vitreoscilla sp.]